MALEEELAKTLQGIHDPSLRVEAFERWGFVGLPSFLSPSRASLFSRPKCRPPRTRYHFLSLLTGLGRRLPHHGGKVDL